MKKTIVYLWLVCIVIFTGCRQETIILHGGVVGFVQILDEAGKLSSEQAGILIKLDDTDIIAITNNNGRFSMTNVPVGTYNLTFERADLGIRKVFSFEVTPGPKQVFLDLPLLMYEKPDYQIKNFEIFKDGASFVFQFASTPISNYDMKIFFSTGKQVDTEKWSYQIPVAYCCFSEPVTHFEKKMTPKELNLPLNQPLYMVAYAKNPKEMPYEELPSGEIRYSTWVQMTNVITVSFE
ncbi:MAG: carboxypeptidase regulatory-like domain-containing protein [Cyclobacteriaceae bacterium]|nr:carboxypeptidase regulatory-like domain-containing protein [Cyclobacteriaceae bacterium]